MTCRVNRHVLRELSGAFGSEKNSDCVIIFCREANLLDVEEHTSSKRRRLEDGSAAPGDQALMDPVDVFGAPLPAHRWVLQAASDRFATKLERWSDDSAGGRPELRIPLGIEDEVPFARAAIAYAYTGEVNAGSIREALQIRRQGEYLGIKDCAADCDAFMERMIQANGTAQAEAVPHERQWAGAPGPSGSSNALCCQQEQQPQLAVLELYDCQELWPDPEAEPSFAAVLNKGAVRLAAHFGSTLKTLNTESLWDELITLPAVGLETLLGSEDFATDTESSVLLLLAYWMQQNYDRTDEETRQRLCRTVRLAQVNKPYRDMVVPGLAADFEANPWTEIGWFSVGVLRALFAMSLSTYDEDERHEMIKGLEGDPWASSACRLLDLAPRPKCIPPEGFTFAWHRDQEALLDGLQQLKQGCESCSTYVIFDQMGNDDVVAYGFLLDLHIQILAGQQAAGLYLGCELPSAYQLPGSRLGKSLSVTTMVPVHVEVKVHRWREGIQQDVVVRFGSADGDSVTLGIEYGNDEVLPLLPQPGAGAGDTGAGGGDPLAAWSEYLKDGKITGTLTLLPQLSSAT